MLSREYGRVRRLGWYYERCADVMVGLFDDCFEREYLTIQIRRFSGNISKTASFIGMERSALHRKLKLLGMGERRDEE